MKDIKVDNGKIYVDGKVCGDYKLLGEQKFESALNGFGVIACSFEDVEYIQSLIKIKAANQPPTKNN